LSSWEVAFSQTVTAHLMSKNEAYRPERLLRTVKSPWLPFENGAIGIL